MSRPTIQKFLIICVSPFFIFQFIDDLTGVSLVGISSGGKSSFYEIGACIACSFFILSLGYLLWPFRSSLSTNLEKIPLVIYGWIALILLQIVSIYQDSTKWVPLAGYLTFIISALGIFMFWSELVKLVQAIAFWGLVCALYIAVGIIQHKEWNTSDVYFTDSIFEKNTYFSPLSGILGLPIRNNFFFNAGPQIFGITFALFFCVALSLPNKFYRVFASVVFLLIGSLSGSRTFYSVVILGLILTVLFRVFKFSYSIPFKIILLVLSILTGFFLVPFGTGSSTNISSFSGRNVIWDIVINHWNDSSILGHGPGTLPFFAQKSYTQFPFVHAHNSLLQYLWDYGVVGFLIILILMFAPLWGLNLFRMDYFIPTYLALLIVQTEITLQANVYSPLSIFWICVSIQVVFMKSKQFQSPGGEI